MSNIPSHIYQENTSWGFQGKMGKYLLKKNGV
jgi:hypothetical protein